MNLTSSIHDTKDRAIAQDSLEVYTKQSQITSESILNTDLYSVGYFEGYIGCEPSHPEQHSYWSGYQVGCREYWAKKLGVKIPTEF